MIPQETLNHFAIELEFVARQLREGRCGNDEIKTLVDTITVIRQTTKPVGTEAEIVSRYEAARTENNLAAADAGAFFWTLVEAVTNETDARALLRRMPSDAVMKASAMDHFIYVSKVIPKERGYFMSKSANELI